MALRSIALQRISRLMPVSYYPAIAGFAIDFVLVMFLPVGMAVYQARVMVGAEEVGNGG